MLPGSDGLSNASMVAALHVSVSPFQLRLETIFVVYSNYPMDRTAFDPIWSTLLCSHFFSSNQQMSVHLDQYTELAIAYMLLVIYYCKLSKICPLVSTFFLLFFFLPLYIY